MKDLSWGESFRRFHSHLHWSQGRWPLDRILELSRIGGTPPARDGIPPLHEQRAAFRDQWVAESMERTGTWPDPIIVGASWIIEALERGGSEASPIHDVRDRTGTWPRPMPAWGSPTTAPESRLYIGGSRVQFIEAMRRANPQSVQPTHLVWVGRERAA